MLKLKTISVITLLLISCLNLFWHFEKNDIEVDEDYLEIINNNSLPKQDLYSDTRAYRSDEKKSQWMDTFEDNSKVSYKNNMVIENGRAKLRADSGTYRSSGSITSDPISPKGNVKWLTFYTNNTKRPFKRKITIDNTLNSNELINYPINFTIDTSSLIDTGKMRSDCGDIRFYNSNNEKILHKSQF